MHHLDRHFQAAFGLTYDQYRDQHQIPAHLSVIFEMPHPDFEKLNAALRKARQTISTNS